MLINTEIDTTKLHELSVIKELNEAVTKSLDSDDLLDVTLKKAMAVSKAQIGSVLMLEPEKGRFRVAASRSLGSGPRKNSYIKINKSLGQHVISKKEPFLVQDIENDSRTRKSNDPKYGPPSFLSMPILAGENLLAVMNLSHKDTKQVFDSNDERNLSIMTGEVGLALENARLHSSVEECMKNIQECNEKLSCSNEQLQLFQKMEVIGTLAGKIIHDLNNILAAILGYTELAILEAQDESKVRKNLEKVKEAGHRAKDLVKQILNRG